MASRLGHDQHGRLIAVQTTDEPGTPAGTVFVLLGNSLEAGGLGVFWMGRTGRPPTLEEQRSAREPYIAGATARRRATEREREREQDDELSDEEALALCRREQERNPPDLIGTDSVRAVYSLA
jgi:hypothetical protein